MSTIFKLAKRYYNTILSNGERMWEKEKIHTLTEMGKLTKSEYKLITGETYK